MADLEALKRQEPGARERFAAAWWPRVYRMALALTGHEADAEDLAQETLMAAMGAAEHFRGEASEATWLYAILLRRHRSRLRRPSLPIRRPGPPQDRAVQDALSFLSRLPAAQKIAAVLFYLEEMSVKEIARAMGVPRATIRWRLFRARRVLRRTLESRSDPWTTKETS